MTAADAPGSISAFGLRSSSPAGRPVFGVGGAAAGLVIVALVIGALTWSAVSGSPAVAQKPTLFAGSVVLADSRPLPVLDLATATVPLRLESIDSEVGARSYGDVQPVTVEGGTMLVNRVTGNFNFLGYDDYVTDPNGPGVGLGPFPGSSGAEGLARGQDGEAFILRSSPSSTVSLVGPGTVAAAARATGREPGGVSPIGYADLGAPVSLRPGSAVVSGGDLWVLAGTRDGCRLAHIHPDPASRQGLVVTTGGSEPSPCDRQTVESVGAGVAVAAPGRVEMITSASVGSRSHTVSVGTPFSAGSRSLLPVAGTGTTAWFLEQTAGGWSLFGVGKAGAIGPFRLNGFGPRSRPAVPVAYGGFLYTVDRAAVGNPTLWAVALANGRMAPVPGRPTYPSVANEKELFTSVQVLASGPRVVFNNPDSVEAVVVFTDSNRPPVVVNKDTAVVVSATGPADVNVRDQPGGSTKGRSPVTAPPERAVPVVQPVSQRVTCASTTQKPYAPQVGSITPSSGAALIQWSYQLLDQTDCEPDSWSVEVTALTGRHQPAHPVRDVEGQQQLLYTGLRPATTYRAVVTAYINAQSTSSDAVTFTTSARGPDAPTSVNTLSDGDGHWVVSWTPCTEAVNPNCVVPADEWTVTGAACNGSYVGSPPTLQVPGTETSVTVDASSLQELGDSLSFSVQGSLASGLTGDPTADGSCTEAWRKPDPSHISLSGAGAQSGDAITATLTVATVGDPTAAFGVPPAQTAFVYRVGGRTVGPTNRTSVTVPGLGAGETYTPSVSIYPVGHPGAAVTVSGRPFSQNLAWPADLVTGTVLNGAPDPTDPNAGTMTVSFPPDTPSGPLEATGVTLNCGSATSEPDQSLGPAGPTGVRTSAWPIDLVQTGGNCALTLTLVDTADPDPYGVPSPAITTPAISIGSQPSYSFTVQVDASCRNQTVGSVCGVDRPWALDLIPGQTSMPAGGGWSVTGCSLDGAGKCTEGADLCAFSTGLSGPPPTPAYTIDLPATCADYRQVQKIDTTVHWTYLGQQDSADAGSPSDVPPPPTTTTTPSTTLAPCPSTTTSATTSTTVACRSGSAAGAAGSAAAAGAGAYLLWAFSGGAAFVLGGRHRSRHHQKGRR